MPDPVTMAIIAGGAQAVSSGYKFHQGVKQKKKGEKKLSSLVEAKYRIPDEAFEAERIADNLSKTGLSENSKDFYADQAAKTQVQTIRSGVGRKGGTSSAEFADANSRDYLREVMMLDSEKRLENNRLLIEQKNNLVDLRNLEFDINELQPYLREREYAEALIGAGITNKTDAVTEFAGTATSLANGFMGASAQSNINSGG